MQKPRKFCYNQYETKEDLGTAHYTCLGHLAEGRAFECRYKEFQIIFNEDKFRIISELGGRCEDFQILPEVKKDFAFLKKELTEKVLCEKIVNETIYLCRHQFIDKGGSPGLAGCCNLCLVDGVAVPCSYNLKDVSVVEEKDEFEFKIKGCEDFQILPEVKKDLTDKLKNKK